MTGKTAYALTGNPVGCIQGNPVVRHVGRRTLLAVMLAATFGTATAEELVAQADTQPESGQTSGAKASPANPSTNPPSASQYTGAFEEVVVTARRRDEEIQSVPIAITALSAEAIQDAAIKSVEDLRFHAPSLQVSPSPFGGSVPGIAIRGQRQLEGLITLDPSVGIYFADFVQVRPHGINSTLYDLESVQVLKGPQGTLFGRNTTGGALLINPKKPVLGIMEGEVSGTVGNYDLYSTTAAINVPVSDTFALRFAGQITRRDGYTTDLADGQNPDDEHTDSFRISALFKPSADLENYTVYQSFRARNAGQGWRLKAVNPSGAVQGAALAALQSTYALLQSKGWHTVYNDQDNREDVDTENISNTTTWTLGDVTLKGIVGYREVETFNTMDYDGSTALLSTGGPAGDVTVFNSQNLMRARQYSAEFQMLGTAFDDRLDWITGLYYFREKGDDEQRSDLFGRRVNAGVGTNYSRSIFAQGTYKPAMVEGLSITAGARRTWDRRKLEARNQIQSLAQSQLGCRLTDENNVPLDPCYRLSYADHAATTWTLNLDYQVNPDTLVYLARRHGYRSGGLQLRANRANEINTFLPEFVDDVELGLKTTFELGSMPVRANLAVFEQDYKDIQRTLSFIDPNVGALVTTVLNAGKAKIKGGEVEVTVLPTDNLELSFSYALTDAKYEEFVNPITGADFSHNQFSYIPKHVTGIGAKYTLPVSSEYGKFVISGNWYKQTSFENSDDNAPNGTGRAEGYELLNLFFDWKDVMRHPVDLRLFVKNVADREYELGGIQVWTTFGTSSLMGAPRTYGMEARYRF